MQLADQTPRSLVSVTTTYTYTSTLGFGNPELTEAEQIKAQEKLLRQLEKQRAEQLIRVREVYSFAESRQAELQKKIDKLQLEIEHLELQEAHLQAQQENHDVMCLPLHAFVESRLFTTVSLFATVANTTLIIQSLVQGGDKMTFWADSCFLLFYIFELLLRLLGSPKKFFCNQDFWENVSNILDVLIVGAGCASFWIGAGLIGQDRRAPQVLALVRLLRLFRLMRLANMMRKKEIDVRWVDSPRFQRFMMFVICSNAVVLAIESDQPHLVILSWLNSVILMLYLFELLARVKLHGLLVFFRGEDWRWNLMDVIVVAGCVLDMWVLPSVTVVQMQLGLKSETESHKSFNGLMALRMARVFRILRFVRVIRWSVPLHNLVIGILESLQGMIWVFTLAAVLLYTCGILAVQLAGPDGILVNTDGDVREDVREIFPTVPQSMFVLFNVMNGETQVIEPMINAMPISKLWFAVFIIIANWAILAILTAVVSENLIRAQQERDREDKDKETNQKKEASRKELEKLFDAAKHSRTAERVNNMEDRLSWEEFEESWKNKAWHRKLHEVAGQSIPEEDDKGMENDREALAQKEEAEKKRRQLEELFQLLCKTPHGHHEPVIMKKHFLEVLELESRQVTERSMRTLERRLTSLKAAVENALRFV